MSFVIASPEALLAAATDLAAIRSTIRAANAAAAVPTTGALAPAADEVSAGIAALFGAQAQSYQAVSAQAAAFHDRFVQLLNAGGGSYASAEIANAQQNLLNAVNAPTQTLLGRPLVGDGAQRLTRALHQQIGVLRPQPHPAGVGPEAVQNQHAVLLSCRRSGRHVSRFSCVDCGAATSTDRSGWSSWIGAATRELVGGVQKGRDIQKGCLT